MSNRCAPPARDNDGLQTTPTPDVSMEPGHLPGGTGKVLTANKEPAARPKQFVFNALQNALSLVPGYSVQITHEGGRADRESTKNHPSGDAADFQLIKNSIIVKPTQDHDAYTKFISGLVGDSLLDNKVVGIGMYNWGVHFDQSAWRQTGSGGVAQWNGWGSNPAAGPSSVLSNGISQGRDRADQGLRSTSTAIIPDGSSGEVAAAEAFSDDESGKQQQTVCDPEGAGSNPAPKRKSGCTPIGPGTVSAAKSMMEDNGLAVSPALTESIGDLSNNALMSEFENISSLAENMVIPDGLVTDAVSQLSQTSFDNFSLANLDKTYSSLTGKLSGPLQDISGFKGAFTSGITGIADQIFSGGNLKNFAETFNKVKGAVGIATNLSSVIEQMPAQVFGDAGSIINGLGTNVFEDIAGMSIDRLAGSVTQSLLGDQEQVLNNLLNDGVKTFAAFSSVYKNFDSMVTQGMGTLTSDVPALGKDLKSLGSLGNMQDLLRVGKAGQVAEQIAISGSTAGITVVEKLVQHNIPLNEINKPENDSVAMEILDDINDPELIKDAFAKLNINRTPVKKMSDVLDPNFMFPESKDSNNFTNLNDAGLHLAVCGAQGFESLSDFGTMLESFETVSADTNISTNYMPAPPTETYDLKAELSPTSDYAGDGDLTVADFIGTAAGYGHTERAKDIKILMDDFHTSQLSVLYRELVTILNSTLNGDNTSGSTISISTTIGGATYDPVRSEYVFGNYSSMDDAVTAITGALGSELDWIAGTGAAIYGFEDKLKSLQNLWEESNSQMYKEADLRKTYGISIESNPRTYDVFGGTGSKTDFVLTKKPATSDDVEVYVDGVRQSKRLRWSYNSTDNQVEFSSSYIPSNGAEIEIAYTNENSPPNGSTADVWGLATELEDLATSTGFGKEADFLSRIVSNDEAGSRIKATMVQSRNRQRAAASGMECPGYNRALSDFYNDNPNGVVNFVELTGIWSEDPGRASEIYLQKQQKVNGREQYFANRLNKFSVDHQVIFNEIMKKTLAQLLFYINDNIALTEVGANIYNGDKITIDTSLDFPITGYVLGPSSEIISNMLLNEGYDSEVFRTPLSTNTKDYLNNIGIDLKKLMAALQNTLLESAENYLGMSRTDITKLFGVPSVSVSMLENMRDNNCY